MLLAASLLISLVAGALEEEADADGWSRLRQPVMKLRYVDRPLTLRSDSFAIFGDLAYGQFSPKRPAVAVAVGAGYGVNDDFEAGLVLLRLVMSPEPGTGIGDPQAYLQYRVLRGDVELAGAIESTIPLGGTYELGARVSLLVRVLSFVRIDLTPVITLTATESWDTGAVAPIELRLQVSDHVSLAAFSAFSMPNLRKTNVLVRFGGRAAYTFGDETGATADLGLLFATPDKVIHGEQREDPALGNYFTVSLALRWFMDNPNDPSPGDWNEL